MEKISHYKQPNREISLRPNGKRLYRPDTLARKR